jgi:signal transduction histidine kinase
MPIKILAVDDEPYLPPLMQQIFRREIRAGKYELSFASSGLETLDMLQTAPDIDIVLTDINMPNMDGLTLLAKISELKPRLNPVLTPVILSAYDDIKNIRRAMNEGAFDFLIKPISTSDFRLTLKKTAEHVLKLKSAMEQEKMARVALQRLNEELEQRVKERTAELDAFARTVAHDLKGPLGMLVSYSDLLLDGADTFNKNELASIYGEIQKVSYKAVNIVDELLLLASVRRGAITLQPLNMAQIVEHARMRLSHAVADRQATIVIPNSWPVALGYASWVEEVWVNYINNALKYGGSPPHIELGYNSLADDIIRFWVADNGPGISPDQQDDLFSEFTRLDHIRAQGHGLGLSIVKRIVDKLGGQVGVESDVGSGSCFYFTLAAA